MKEYKTIDSFEYSTIIKRNFIKWNVLRFWPNSVYLFCLLLKQYVDSYKKISNMVHKIYLRLKGKFNLEIVAFIKNQKKLKTLKINYQIQTTNH